MKLSKDEYMTRVFLPPHLAESAWRLVGGKDITSLDAGIRRAVELAYEQNIRNNNGKQSGKKKT